ncbi:MAG TPA: hypothetical protein VGA33_02855 [Thermoanaerobaculia bacterium]
MILCAVVLAAATVVADERLDQVASDFRTIGRIAALADNLRDNRQVMLAIVDNDLEMLREKRPDETYRWASLQREEASRVKDQKSIERVQSEKELREVTLTAPNAYRLEVSVPTKQSLVSKNNRVYIRNVIVDSTGFDGKITHQTIPVNEWVNPGDAHSVPLPEIGKSVKAMVELGVESGDKHAVADVALLQAKLMDDPAGPHYPAVQQLLKTREVLTQKDLNRGFLKTTVDEALLSLPGEMEKRTAEQAATVERRRQTSGAVAAGDASPDVVAALDQIARLLGGNLQDQTDARAKLQALIDTLQGKPAAAKP